MIPESTPRRNQGRYLQSYVETRPLASKSRKVPKGEEILLHR